jgi:N-acetyl-gamma-glutamyl-phosphate reductase common form
MSLRVSILHGAGYTGGELIRLVLGHPDLELAAVTSRTFKGKPLWDVHTGLRGSTNLNFSAPDSMGEADAVFLAAEHGQGAVAALALEDAGFEGFVIDLSADFRLADPADYERRYGREHPAPHLAGSFEYGLADLRAPYKEGTRRIANPGCFATGIALSLAPIARTFDGVKASVTALTGASGSGARPSATTHFPTRSGNVRAYKVFGHQHMAEVSEVLGPHSRVDFVPVSGPWTRGIWGAAHIERPPAAGMDAAAIAQAMEATYRSRPLVRLWPERLPELHWSVGTPYCDIGWVVKEDSVVVGFGLDNLLKGAASQAIHNLNLIAGLPETRGLLP